MAQDQPFELVRGGRGGGERLRAQERSKDAETLPNSGAVPREQPAVDDVDAAGLQGRYSTFKWLEIPQMSRMERVGFIGQKDDLHVKICHFRQ